MRYDFLGARCDFDSHPSPQNKSIFQRIVWIDPQFVATDNVRFATHFRDDCLVRTKPRLPDNFSCKLAANNTLDHNGLILLNLAACMMDRESSTDTGSRWTSIHFTFREDAHVLTL